MIHVSVQWSLWEIFFSSTDEFDFLNSEYQIQAEMIVLSLRRKKFIE